MGSAPVIALHELRKTFRVRRPSGSGLRAVLRDYVRPTTYAVAAVERLSFTINRGERVAFIGPNGAGKSTTLKVLAGILRADSGTVRVLGYEPFTQRRALATQIGTVFGQRSQLWYQLPPRDTFRLLGHVYGLTREAFRARLDALVSAFRLEPLLDTPVRQLSLGERMRCEIAASLLHGPRVLFLDEPTIGLDVSAKAVTQELLCAESTREGVTLLLTSHDTGDIERMCDRAIVINSGTLLWDGPLSVLRSTYVTTKLVTVWTDAEHVAVSEPGITTISSHAYRTDLEVTLSVATVGQAIEAVQAHAAIRDVAVDDAPLDAVIRALYARANATGGDS